MQVKTVSDVLANCVSKDKHRMVLQCVVEDRGKDGVYRVATDTHRLAALKMDDSAVGEGVSILYPDHLAIALKVINYPHWRRVMPEAETLTRLATVPITPLIRALKAVGEIAKDNSYRVIFAFEGSTLNVRGKSEAVGTVACDIHLPTEFKGDRFEIGLNYKYILDALPVSREKDFENAVFGMSHSSRPVKITYETCGDFAELSYMIMPIALEKEL
jgi:DNA polymerase III sliding clamp (beta) subunit (PCNA family)